MSAGARSGGTKESESCHRLNNRALAPIFLSATGNAQAVFLAAVGVSRTVNGEITVV